VLDESIEDRTPFSEPGTEGLQGNHMEDNRLLAASYYVYGMEDQGGLLIKPDYRKIFITLGTNRNYPKGHRSAPNKY
jgi:hypothetical protein